MKIAILIVSLYFAIVATSTTSYSTNKTASDSTQTCIVSGETIEGSGVKYTYLNKDITFCCEGCQLSFKKNPAKYLSSAGLRCPVCDEDDAKETLSFVNEDVKYYFCGKGCKNKFSKNPEEYLKKYKE